MRNVFLQLVCTKSDTYSSHGDTTTTCQSSESGLERVSFCNEYSDDPDTPANKVGLNMPLPTETTEQIPLTPTASAAVDAKDTATLNVRVMDDNDEMWATEADHRTGWNKTFKGGTYRGMLYGIVLRDYPQKGCITDQSKERHHKHARVPFLGTMTFSHRRDSILCGTQAGRHLLVRVQVDVKSFLTKTRTRIPSG